MDLYWTGSDCLFMHDFAYIGFKYKLKIIIFRFLVNILDKWFIERNLIISEHLRTELNLIKPIYVYNPPFKEYKYNKIEHKEFNILYYMPKGKNKKFLKYIYGYDIYKMLIAILGDKVKWIEVDGTADMTKIYPYIDFYLRCNRHDGMPYMVKECEGNDIPYYWSKENPEVHQAYRKIKECYDNLRSHNSI